MKYRLIATDMDGTLLQPDDTISTATLKAIEKAREKGVVFTLSTGRPVQGVKKYIDLLGLDCPVITYNGAVVVHSGTGDILFSQEMDKEDARLVYNLALEKGVMFILWSKNRLYASELGEKISLL